MFDGVPQPQSPSGGSSLTGKQRVSRPVMIATLLALLGAVLTVLLPSDPSQGFHIESIGPQLAE